tara:strand:- start:493 stop:921 length:429 start_codon:yes stop_codon:yes gene_type:complete
MKDELEQKIDNMEWTLFDRFLYGGLGHGYLCFPTNLVRILFTVLFPPLGTILRYLKISTVFPYITMETLVNLLRNIDDIIYAFVLTALFYIPGLIYGLSSLKCAETSGQDAEAMEDLKEVSVADIKDHFADIKRKKKIRNKL